MMRARIAGIVLLVLVPSTAMASATTQAAEWPPIASSVEEAVALLDNGLVTVFVDLAAGEYELSETGAGDRGKVRAHARINEWASNASGLRHSCSVRDVRDALGEGRTLILTSAGEDRPSIVLEITVYRGRRFFAIAAGLDNVTGRQIRVKQIRPLAGSGAFAGLETAKDLRMLNGISGGGDSKVTAGPGVESPNNLLVTFTAGPRRRAIVAGGLTYHDFVKYAAAKLADDRARLALELWCQDPCGRRVDPQTRYKPDDRFYLDLSSNDPFNALEQYGLAVRSAQSVQPNIYDFPTLCGWYASSAYPGCPFVNDTNGMVAEMDGAARSGFLKYSRVAVRLVPDAPGNDNEQGWWDDEHWRRYKHYVPPYDTSEKWAKAVIDRGGIPFTYVQTGIISVDFMKAHPEWALYNDVSKVVNSDGSRNNACNYDYTDPGFQEHMRGVWANLRRAGVRGVMFDYPGSGWREGGFEDPYATSAAAYRMIFELAKTGLGPDSFVHERNIGQYKNHPLSDVTIGLVDSQRVMWDTDLATPEMYTKCGLRWYKNRVLYTYDMDAKNFLKVRPANRDGLRQMLTMAYVVGGRLLLATSFSRMSPDDVRDLSRIYPMHAEPRSARPIDAFTREGHPRVYDFAVEPDWHQLTLFNPDMDKAAPVGVDPGAPVAESGMGLDPRAEYYVYDFWNDAFAGRVRGSERIEPLLRPGEVRMLSVRRALDRPQVLSTNRHIMQGWLDLLRCEWDASLRRLAGVSRVVAGEPYEVVIAANGFKPTAAKAGGARCSLLHPAAASGWFKLVLESAITTEQPWSITFAPERTP